MYAIKNAGAKGLGVFATEWIARGTRIMAERPVFTVKAERELYAATRNLQQDDLNHILQLSVNAAEAKSTTSLWAEAAWHLFRNRVFPTWDETTVYAHLLAAFRNNNFDLGASTHALFRDVSRLNHACVPNAQANFNTTLGRFTIHAVRALDAGEEVTISYLAEHGAMRASRQARLAKGYGFSCGCGACDLGTEAGRRSEARRAEMRERLGRFAEEVKGRKEPDLQQEAVVVGELIGMFEAEGLGGRELSTM